MMVRVNPQALAAWANDTEAERLCDSWATSAAKHEAERLIGELAAQALRVRTVVDLGCGPGRLIPHLKFKEYLGVDLSSYMLARARRDYGVVPGVRFEQGNFLTMTAPENLFGLALATPSRNYDGAFDFMRAVLERWPARYYLFTVLHGPEAQELLNGWVTATAQVEAELPALGQIVDQREQHLADFGLWLRFALVKP